MKDSNHPYFDWESLDQSARYLMRVFSTGSSTELCRWGWPLFSAWNCFSCPCLLVLLPVFAWDHKTLGLSEVCLHGRKVARSHLLCFSLDCLQWMSSLFNVSWITSAFALKSFSFPQQSISQEDFNYSSLSGNMHCWFPNGWTHCFDGSFLGYRSWTLSFWSSWQQG